MCGLMLKLSLIPVFKCYLNELKINVANKSYSRDNRLNKLEKLRSLGMLWHLDVTGYKPKSVVSLLV